jgi:phosphatidylinositol-3-phosphatase
MKLPGIVLTAAAVLLSGCSASNPAALPGSVTGSSAGAPRAVAPHASHVTIVLMENHDYDLVAGSRQAPYFNKTLVPQGVLLRNSHAIGHPSEPNYVALFSGSTHGLQGDPCPVYFSAANVASESIAAGKTFTGYAESMPRDGYKGCYSGLYDRNHNPWVAFTNVPAADNRVYRGFPAAPASFVWITPNLCDDTHDCSVRKGDAWLAKNLPPIVAWDQAHDGLLILTWDEADPDADGTNHIATVFVGPDVVPGVKDVQRVDHYSVLRTIETIFGLACIDKECGAPVVAGIWK